jgi:hypothetical protein
MLVERAADFARTRKALGLQGIFPAAARISA